MVNREEIIGGLVKGLEPLGYINALWEGGAAAFKRTDEWSDIDLIIDVKDGKVEETFHEVDEILGSISPIEIKYRLPEPTWHGNSQAFYRLESTSPFLLIDLSVIKESSCNKFTEKEIHGESRFYFDKNGTKDKIKYSEKDTEEETRKRLQYIKDTFELFKIMPLKEINRKNYIEAFSFYNAFILRPLTDLLRIKYSLHHYNFGSRYVYYELPGDVVSRLEKLYFPGSPDEFSTNYRDAVGWTEDLLKGLSGRTKSNNNLPGIG